MERRRRRRSSSFKVRTKDLNTSRLVGLYAFAAIPPLLLGGEPGWAVLPIGMAAVALLAMQVRRAPSLTIDAMDGAMFLGLAMTLLQLVPVPGGLLDRAPVAESLELAGQSTNWLPISMDPGATLERLVVGASLCVTYLAGRCLAVTVGRRHVIRAVATSTALMACVAFGHEVLSADLVFGVWDTAHRNPTLMAPLTNSNHLGGFLAFGCALWMGLAVSAEARNERALSALAGAVCGLGALGCGSRGAALSLVAGLLWAVAVTFAWERKRKRGRQRWLLVGVVAVVAVVGVTLGFVAGIHQDFVDGEYSKVELIQAGAALATEHPLLGVGRGAFEAAFAEHGASVRFTHPENILVHWAVEWGVPFALLLLFVSGQTLLRSARSRHVEVAVASGALAALVLHDLVDFALEMPGIVVVVAVLLGALVRRPTRGPSLNRRRLMGLALGLAAIIVGLGLGVNTRRPEAFESRFAEVNQEHLEELVAEAIRLHPVDPRVTLFASAAMVRLRETESIRWVNRTMVLAPSWPSPHLLAAEALYVRGALPQALLEAREAIWLGDERGGLQFLCVLAPRSEIEDLVRVVPDDQRAGNIGLRISQCLGERGEVFDNVLVDLRPDSVDALARRARRALRDERVDDALADVRRALELDPDREMLRVLRARITAERDPDQALEQLGEVDSWQGLSVQAELAARSGNDELRDESLASLRQRSAGQPTKLAQAWEIAGRVMQSEGRVSEALRAFERAHTLDSRENRYLRQMAALARRENHVAKAQFALRELCRRRDETACRQLERGRNSARMKRRLP